MNELAFFLWQGFFFAFFLLAMSNPGKNTEPFLKPITDDAILKVAKEIVIKFIEVGRLAPGNFDETFRAIYQAVRDTVKS